MYRTCILFLVLLHRTFLMAAVLIGGTYAFRAIENHYRRSDQQLELTHAAEFCYTVLTTIGKKKKQKMFIVYWNFALFIFLKSINLFILLIKWGLNIKFVWKRINWKVSFRKLYFIILYYVIILVVLYLLLGSV